jgi:hypothetical protein
MGRGRAKAKQTKVARELKYSSPQTDFERLQRELSESGVGESDPLDDEDPRDRFFGDSDDSWDGEEDWSR